MKRSAGLWIVVVAAFVVFGCAADDNAENIAEALEERLTDALDFEDGEVVEGTPPEGSGGADAPQIEEIVAPSELRLGDMFTVELPTQFADPTAIEGAYVHVEGATRYIVVNKRAVGNTVYLYGKLGTDEKLRGETFNVRIALRTATATGMYKVWELHILDEEPIGGGEPIEGVILPDEEWHDSGRPEGTAGENAPQISGIVHAPKEVYLNYPVDLGIQTDDFAGEIAAVLLTTPGNKGYKRTTRFEAVPAKTVYTIYVEVTITNEQFSGGRVVLLFALEDAEGNVGLWVPWEFVVYSGTPPDGDEDLSEPEPEPEPEPEEETYPPVWIDTANNLMWQVVPPADTMNWYDAQSYCETLDLEGYNDWYLPSIDEMRTIIAGCENTSSGGACGVTEECSQDTCWTTPCGGCEYEQGPHPLGCWLEPELSEAPVPNPDCFTFWSSTSVYNLDNKVWLVDNSLGAIINDFTDGLYYVRCVRSLSAQEGDGDEEELENITPEIEVEPEPEEEEPYWPNETWLDPRTGLLWQVHHSDQGYTLDQAWAYCEDLRLDGLTGWRLPTIDELRTIIDGCPNTEPGGACQVSEEQDCLSIECFDNRVCYGCDEGGGPHPAGCYLKSTLYADEHCSSIWSANNVSDPDFNLFQWFVDFANGSIEYLNNTYLMYVRCVNDAYVQPDGDEEIEPEPEIEFPELEEPSSPFTPVLNIEDIIPPETEGQITLLSNPFDNQICFLIIQGPPGEPNYQWLVYCYDNSTSRYSQYGTAISNADIYSISSMLVADGFFWLAGDGPGYDLFWWSDNNNEWTGEPIYGSWYDYTSNYIKSFQRGLAAYQYYLIPGTTSTVYTFYQATDEAFVAPTFPSDVNYVWDTAVFTRGQGTMAAIATDVGIYYTSDDSEYIHDDSLPTNVSPVYVESSSISSTRLWFVGLEEGGTYPVVVVGYTDNGTTWHTTRLNFVNPITRSNLLFALVSDQTAFLFVDHTTDYYLYRLDTNPTSGEVSYQMIPNNFRISMMVGDPANSILWASDALTLYKLKI